MKRREEGLGFIELLIALLLLSVGALGLLAVQLVSWRTSIEGAQVSQATALARDLLARIDSNPEALRRYVRNEPRADSPPSADLVLCHTAAADDAATPRCDPEALAAYDLLQWLELLAGGPESATGLPEPVACIVAQEQRVTVAIAWRGPRAAASPVPSRCGAGLGRYGPDDQWRRVVALRTWFPAGRLP